MRGVGREKLHVDRLCIQIIELFEPRRHRQHHAIGFDWRGIVRSVPVYRILVWQRVDRLGESYAGKGVWNRLLSGYQAPTSQRRQKAKTGENQRQAARKIHRFSS